MKNLNRALISTFSLALGLGFSAAGCSSDGPATGAGGSAVGAGGSSAGGAAPGSGGNVVPMGGGATVGGSAAGGGGNPGGGNASGGSDPGAGGANVGGGAPAGGAEASGGNEGTGGDGTTEGDPIPKPKLITSAAGAFWKTDVEPTMGGTTATITVDPATTHQDWIGWGGTFNEKGWSELSKLQPAERERIMKLLFSRVEGLGLGWGRIPIGASDYAMDRYTLCDEPCNATNIETAFSLDRDKDPDTGLIPYIKAAQAVIEAEKAQYKGIKDTKFWGSPWTPPPWMKSNNAYDKGVMKNDTATRKAYAKYFRLWVEGYEAEGIPIDHVYPQNEPGWAQAYPSCAWGPFTDNNTANTSTPAFLGDFVEDDLLPELNGLADVWFGTLSNNSHFPAYWGSLGDKSKVKGIGLQWETVASINTPVSAGVKVMQSEHKCGNYPWVEGAGNGMNSTAASAEAADSTTFWKDWAPNNYNYAVESWGLFKQWIEAGANGYSAWNMVLDRVGRNLDVARPWPQNALISFNQDGSTNVTPYYYAFRHLAQYAEAGGKRIKVTGGNALAFKNPDGSIVVAMYNSGAAAQTTLSIGGTMMQFTIPQRGFATVNWTP